MNSAPKEFVEVPNSSRDQLGKRICGCAKEQIARQNRGRRVEVKTIKKTGTKFMKMSRETVQFSIGANPKRDFQLKTFCRRVT
jgi:hypothetical protein